MTAILCVPRSSATRVPAFNGFGPRSAATGLLALRQPDAPRKPLMLGRERETAAAFAAIPRDGLPDFMRRPLQITRSRADR
jgi:hypothetical protein